MEYYKCLSNNSIQYTHKGNNLIEKWMSIKGFENIYEVSDLGRVRSLDRWVVRKNSNIPIWVNGQIKKQSFHKNGYLSTMLNKNGLEKRIHTHTIVADSFLINPFNKRTINHLDGNKLNNVLFNLERATDSENQKHTYYTLNRIPYWLGKQNKKRNKPIICTNNNIIYESISDAASKLNLSKGCVCSVCKGVKSNTKGLIFKYA